MLFEARGVAGVMVADDRPVDGADHHGLGNRHRTAASQLSKNFKPTTTAPGV